MGCEYYNLVAQAANKFNWSIERKLEFLQENKNKSYTAALINIKKVLNEKVRDH